MSGKPLTLREVAEYADIQADRAQVRLLKRMNDSSVLLYNDEYWQGVLDLIRYELLRICDERGE